MDYRKVTVVAVIVLLAIVLLCLYTAKPVFSATPTDGSEQTILRVRPSTVINFSKGQGEEFIVNVTAMAVQSLHGFRMQLDYDARLIGCLYVQEGPFLRGFGNTTMIYAIDDVLGDVFVSLNLTYPTVMANGNGTLIAFTFNVTGTGDTKLSFNDVNLYDSSGSPLAYVTFGGYFNNKLNLDFTMPLVLFAVTLVSMFLNGRVEGKLKSILEDREFRIQDAVLLVGMMTVMIYLIVFVREVTLILMGLFLFSYSLLLFEFGYLFSKNRWYIGILPPALFLLLYAFLRDTSVWVLYLSNVYGLIFAVLITLYMVGLFTWKTTAIFGVLITIMDIILVLVTGTMIEAANVARSLNLPVLVSLPLFPLVVTGDGLLMLALGLGDFFFAGLLGVQTYKRYGKRFAILSVVGMTVSFFVFEVFLLNFLQRAFPGTLMIICGWAPFAIWKEVTQRRRSLSKTETCIQNSSVENKESA